MYFYDMGDFQIVGASPEILVRQEHTPEGDEVTIRPLAGTRPRGATPEQTRRWSRTAGRPQGARRAPDADRPGAQRHRPHRQDRQVKVTEAFGIERYSHVMHIVSNVEGMLKDGMSSLDVLRATFPAGTLTGAPKIRAMEIIDELEPVKRGIYGGACGYLSFAGDMDVAIAIRTGIVKDNTLYVQAAAGVVADSVPENGMEGDRAKARADPRRRAGRRGVRRCRSWRSSSPLRPASWLRRLGLVQVMAADGGVGQHGDRARLHFQDAAGDEDELFPPLSAARCAPHPA
jgi:anthranilate synthase component 1